MTNPDPHRLMPAGAPVFATITPSGNTVVERTTMAMLRHAPGVGAVFSRSPVHGGSDPFPDSYDWDSMLRAAELLSHAAPGVILWNGSKGGAIGLDRDRELCDRITERTGIRAETSALVLRRLLRDRGWRRIGLVTPYAATYQRRLIAALEAEGLEIVSESHLGLSDNLSYASVAYETIRTQADQVADALPDIVLAWCTNYPAAPLAASFEAATGIPFWDATALGVLGAMQALGVAGPGAEWGSLFAGKA